MMVGAGALGREGRGCTSSLTRSVVFFPQPAIHPARHAMAPLTGNAPPATPMPLWIVASAGQAARRSSTSTWWGIVWVSKGDDLSVPFNCCLTLPGKLLRSCSDLQEKEFRSNLWSREAVYGALKESWHSKCCCVHFLGGNRISG